MDEGPEDQFGGVGPLGVAAENAFLALQIRDPTPDGLVNASLIDSRVLRPDHAAEEEEPEDHPDRHLVHLLYRVSAATPERLQRGGCFGEEAREAIDRGDPYSIVAETCPTGGRPWRARPRSRATPPGSSPR